jgi:tRNA pseudouridine38-40 synthase
VEICEIVPNTFLTANFFPETSYAVRVKGQGFMRHQVRMMMGSLISLGKGEITLEDIRKSLTENRDEPLHKIAPASGLLLNGVEFNQRV